MDEWWKLFIGIAVFGVVAIILSYDKCNQSIWAYKTAGQYDKAKKWSIGRHVIAFAWVAVAAAILIFLKLYMNPYSVAGEYKAYNVKCMNNTPEAISEYGEPDRLVMNLVVRRSIFGEDDIKGNVSLNGINYVLGGSEEEGSCYFMSFSENGEVLPKSEIIMYALKDFDAFQYKYYTDSVYSSHCVGPADSLEEGKQVYEEMADFPGEYLIQ